MSDLVERIYFAKKWFALFPGIRAPRSGPFLASHYDRRRSQRGAGRAVLDALIGLGFHAWIPIRARAVQRKYGLDSDWRRRAARIAHRRFADPNDIALFRIEREEQLDGYIRRFEDAALNKLINPAGWAPGCVLLNKELFYRRCAAAGLPHPEVIAEIVDGRVTMIGESRGRPLLLKPSRGEGGRGVRFLEGEPEEADARGAWARAQAAGLKGVWVIQHRLAVHPAMADLALNALPTVRITTIVNPAGVPEVVSCVLRFPSRPEAEVDNMKAGGILAPVDIATGTLGLGCKGYGGGDYETHPVTGAPVPGRALPLWEEAKALAVRAHRDVFTEYALIGWDVALTPDGPMLVEGNAKPGVLMPQRSGRAGLGGQRYGELLAYQLEQAGRRA